MKRAHKYPCGDAACPQQLCAQTFSPLMASSNSSNYTPDFKVTFRHTGALAWFVMFLIRRGWVKIEFDPVSIKEMFQFSATAILSATDAANQTDA